MGRGMLLVVVAVLVVLASACFVSREGRLARAAFSLQLLLILVNSSALVVRL